MGFFLRAEAQVLTPNFVSLLDSQAGQGHKRKKLKQTTTEQIHQLGKPGRELTRGQESYFFHHDFDHKKQKDAKSMSTEISNPEPSLETEKANYGLCSS